MKKTPRRSIISNFGVFAAGSADAAGAAPERKGGPIEFTTGVVPPRVAAGVIGATQRTLSDIREERDRLQALVAAGAAAELETALIDPSPFRDRLPDDAADAIEALKSSIKEEGQMVPAGVRRHPSAPGRYQLVYGHRRWRAASELGLRLKAIVMEIDDQGLAIAQGVENSARQDLSWIEKALFAARMEEAGMRARAIRGALAVDDAELARFRAVFKSIGSEFIVAVGRAPKVGRPRWVALATRLAHSPEAAARVRKALAAAKALSSDDRFAAAVASLTQSPDAGQGVHVALVDATGRPLGRVEYSARTIRLNLGKRDAELFSAFFRRELPALLERFASERDAS